MWQETLGNGAPGKRRQLCNLDPSLIWEETLGQEGSGGSAESLPGPQCGLQRQREEMCLNPGAAPPAPGDRGITHSQSPDGKAGRVLVPTFLGW